MSNAKEIRTQIKSIQNTQKITKAMELVAASKMRKAQMRMEETRPYAEKIRAIASDLARANTEISHPFLDTARGKERVGYIFISTDRGLCGGLNTNLFRAGLNHMREHDIAGKDNIEVATYGQKGLKYLSGVGANVVASKTQFGDAPVLEDLLGPLDIMIKKYLDGELDRVFLVSNSFVNTMSQTPQVDLLLPISEDFGSAEQTHQWDFVYEPSAEALIEDIITRYIEAILRKAVAENIACEMAARMVAMKSATDNAGTLIKDLKLVYNKARQAAITQEISEIVGGAAAV